MANVPKQAASAAPMIKNSSAAPVIYFDNVPVMGAFSGNIEVELSVRSLMPKPNGSVTAETICVAHLRCSPQAAVYLHDALGKALAIHAKQAKQQGAKVDSDDDDDEASPPLN